MSGHMSPHRHAGGPVPGVGSHTGPEWVRSDGIKGYHRAIPAALSTWAAGRDHLGAGLTGIDKCSDAEAIGMVGMQKKRIAGLWTTDQTRPLVQQAGLRDPPAGWDDLGPAQAAAALQDHSPMLDHSTGFSQEPMPAQKMPNVNLSFRKPRSKVNIHNATCWAAGSPSRRGPGALNAANCAGRTNPWEAPTVSKLASQASTDVAKLPMTIDGPSGTVLGAVGTGEDHAVASQTLKSCHEQREAQGIQSDWQHAPVFGAVYEINGPTGLVTAIGSSSKPPPAGCNVVWAGVGQGPVSGTEMKAMRDAIATDRAGRMAVERIPPSAGISPIKSAGSRTMRTGMPEADASGYALGPERHHIADSSMFDYLRPGASPSWHAGGEMSILPKNVGDPVPHAYEKTRR